MDQLRWKTNRKCQKKSIICRTRDEKWQLISIIITGTPHKKTLKFAFISNMLMFLFHFLRTSANHIITVCGLILIVFNDMIDHFHLMVQTEPIDRSSDMGWCGKHFPLGMLMSYATISDFFNLQKNNLYFTCNWWSISLVMKKKN